MKYLMLALLLTGCGNYYRGPAGTQGAPGPAGSPGPQGPAGQNGADGVSVDIFNIPLCHNIVGTGFNESLLEVGGSYYGVYFDGAHAFLIKLPPGNYETTDGRHCRFNLATDGVVTEAQ